MPSPIRSGHWSALSALDDRDAYRETRGRFAKHIEAGVYLRLTDGRFTVLSLDWDRCSSMIGVGGGSVRPSLTAASLPPTAERVSSMVEAYEEKIACLSRTSSEEMFAVRALARALDDGLRLPLPRLHLVHQEWRLAEGGRIDLLGVNPGSRRLAVIELKKSATEARRVDPKKGGDAWAQALHYAELLFAQRSEYYPLFEKLARAMAELHDGPEPMKTLELDVSLRPETHVLWPADFDAR